MPGPGGMMGGMGGMGGGMGGGMFGMGGGMGGMGGGRNMVRYAPPQSANKQGYFGDTIPNNLFGAGGSGMRQDKHFHKNRKYYDQLFY